MNAMMIYQMNGQQPTQAAAETNWYKWMNIFNRNKLIKILISGFDD